MPNKLVVDAQTGAAEAVPLSADELAKLQAAAASPQIAPVVSMRQARLALLNAGLYDQVNAAIAKASVADQIWWEYSQDVHRSTSLVTRVQAALGLTDQQIDQLFIAAAALP